MTRIERLRTTGILRSGTPRQGFRYAHVSGGRPATADLRRIASLRIPPAWKDVAISPTAGARVQAIGRDAAGRWQYIYHPNHVRNRERQKYARLARFGEALPRLRRAVAQDLRARDLTRDRVLAAMVRILANASLRPGSEVYAAENGSYGVATLRRRHVAVAGATLRLDFPGKSGQRQQRTLRDPAVARVVRRLLSQSDGKVFRCVDATGERLDLGGRDINAYVKRHMGAGFTAKDFRTWSGTLLCACLLARADCKGESRTAVRKAVAAAIRETARHLGNTPAVCRSSYVSPRVLRSFERGQVIGRFIAVDGLVGPSSPGLRAAERALLRMLAGGGPRRTAELRIAFREAA
jgi:DNA topoisomerase-1